MDNASNKLDTLQRTHLKQQIVVKDLVTLYYFEHGKNFIFKGERHNFWELLYVDRGEIEVFADGVRSVLRQGSIIFHKPNEFHQFHATEGNAPNVIVISFDCHSALMKRLETRVMQVGEEERNLLVQIMNEGRNAFEFPFRHPLQRRKKPVPGCEQMLRNYLEILLLCLVRKLDSSCVPVQTTKPLSPASRETHDANEIRVICRYIEEHLGNKLTVAQLCSQFYMNRIKLQWLFKKHTSETLVRYINKARIERAKTLIREEGYNLTQIATLVGYANLHYFSFMFKKETDMSPTEYARSVKAMM